MRSSTFLSACNRIASTVDLKAAANVPNIITNMLSLSVRVRNLIGGFTDEKIGFATAALRAIGKRRH